MPAWGIHLYIANKLNKKLNLDEQSFLLGNVLPDIYSGWILNNTSKILEYDVTHYSSKKIINEKIYTLPDYDKFIKENIGMEKSPIFLGYLSHLISDYYFNYYAFKNHYLNNGELTTGIIDKNGKIIACDKELAREIKQKDFKKFSFSCVTNIYKKPILINDKIIEDSFKIKYIDIQEEDLFKVQKYLNEKYLNENFFDEACNQKDEEYIMFSEKELEELTNKCVEYILNIFKEYNLIGE